ncbi:hypothetical protein PC123_g22613 [Phytophthora cactorum]|nr:hypothetical protein PC123_g22613 [Phytophthora cactorum]
MDSSKKTVLITGSTRGIGLAFAEQYTKAGWNVIGTARADSSTEKLSALGPLKISCAAVQTSTEQSKRLSGLLLSSSNAHELLDVSSSEENWK